MATDAAESGTESQEASALRGADAAHLSRRYMLFGIVVGLLAPAGLLLYAIITETALDPIRLFLVLAVGGTTAFAILGRIIGRRDEALIVRNRELAALSAVFEELSTIDALTGIANRRTFDERLQMEVGRSARYRLPCALVMIDLDRFKTLNDRFGHRAGDQVLRQLGALLSAEKRAEDLVARYGGEEFAAILPNVDARAASVWAERVRARLAREHLRWEDADLSISASFGVAAAPAHGQTVAHLVQEADRALYEAKRRGRNQTIVAPPRGPTIAAGPT